MNAKYTILATVLFIGCTTLQDSTTPTAAATAAQPSEFKNLKVLPPTTTRDQLIPIMKAFASGLGVKCNHCHVVTKTEPKEELDFASDAKEEKRVARVMMQMTHQINHEWLERVEAAEGHAETSAPAEMNHETPKVMCWTCHRGKIEPEMPPAPAPAPAR